MYAGGGYNLGNYDPRTGKEASKIVGSQSVGNLSLKYLFEKEDEDEEQSEEIENEEAVLPNAASSKIAHSLAMGASDPYPKHDRSAGQLKNTGGAGAGFLQEFAGYHKNPTRKGMSPYKQPKHSGPPLGTGGSGQAFRTTGNKVDLGSRKGWSRAYHSEKQGDQKRYFSLQSLVQDTHDGFHQFTRQKNKVKKIIREISN